MASIGIPKDIVNRIPNHGVPQIASIYDQHPYFHEKAGTLQKWASRAGQHRRGFLKWPGNVDNIWRLPSISNT